MPFSPGTPKPAGSGRKAGTPNRATAQAALVAEEMGVDPLRILLLFASGDAKGLGWKSYVDRQGKRVQPRVPAETQMQAAVAAARHLYPQLKAIDHAVSGGAFADIMALSPEELDRRRAEIDMALADDDAAYSQPSTAISNRRTETSIN